MDGKEGAWANDDSFVRVASTEGTFKIVQFNPKTHAVSTTSTFIKNGPAVFDVAAGHFVLFQLSNTQINKLTTTNNWKTYTSVLVYDFANCLPAGIKVTWVGSWSTSVDTKTFSAPFSDRGDQGSGEYYAAYRKGVGCSYINTLTGAVIGWKGKQIGTVDDGVNPLIDRFTIHDGDQSLNPDFASFGASDNDNSKPPLGTGGSGCKAGNCTTDTPYFWQIGTTHLRVCSPHTRCSGHAAEGYLHWANGKQVTLHLFSNPAQPLLNLANLPGGGYDMGGSWINTNATTPDEQPLEIVNSWVTQTLPPFDGPYENEIMMVASDGSKVWRMGQTLNSGASPYYICQNSHASISPDGKFVLFASDMGGKGALGYEADGKTSRCDAFAMELK